MNDAVEVIRFGRLPYREAHARMCERLAARIAGGAGDGLLIGEHEPVFTVGRRFGASLHVLDPGDVPVIEVERGGDVTYHGPGQVVGYPIVQLGEGRRDLHAWLHGLEDVLIAVLARWGLRGGRDARNTGVWIDGRKVAAIGVACKRWVTWHGFALNVDVDLAAYRRVSPCGMDASTVTRMADHLDACPAVEDVTNAVADEFVAWLGERQVSGRSAG